MIIQYAQNPLDTKVFLNETEKKLLFYRYKLEELSGDLFTIQFDIEQAITRTTPHENEWVEEKYGRIRKTPHSYLRDKTYDLWKHVTYLEYDESGIRVFIDALQQPHCGDCVNVSTRCDKCEAESLVGVNTLDWEGLTAAINCKINWAFFHSIHKTIGCAIAFLEGADYLSHKHNEDYESAWQKNKDDAVAYLKDYKKNKLGE